MIGKNSTIINALIVKLNSIFSLKDIGMLKIFLGMEVTHTIYGIHLSQSKDIHDLLERVQLCEFKIVSTPMVPSQDLSKHDGEDLPDASLYRTIVRAL